MTFQTYTHRKNVVKLFLKKDLIILGELTGNRQCHRIMTIYFSSSCVYRSFTGKRQHFEIRNAGDFDELGVELHFLYCFS